jgi:hypothetical protein
MTKNVSGFVHWVRNEYILFDTYDKPCLLDMSDSNLPRQTGDSSMHLVRMGLVLHHHVFGSTSIQSGRFFALRYNSVITSPNRRITAVGHSFKDIFYLL